MIKIASIKYDILDFILEGDLEKVASIIPNLSKEAQASEILDLEDREARPNEDFAVVLSGGDTSPLKKFAMYDKPSTEVSVAFLSSVADSLPDEVVKVASTNLYKRASEYGLTFPDNLLNSVDGGSLLPREVDATTLDQDVFVEKLASYKESQVTDWALPDEKMYPIRSHTEIIKAADYFERYHQEFEEPSRAIEFASNVKKASVSAGVSLEHPKLEKFASLETNSFNPLTTYFIQKRASFIPGSETEKIAAYEALAEKKLAPKETFEKLASLDTSYGLSKYWGKGIENPATSVYQVKVAADRRDRVMEKLQRVDKTALTGLVGTDAVGDLLGPEGAEVYETLPHPIKKELNNLMADLD